MMRRVTNVLALLLLVPLTCLASTLVIRRATTAAAGGCASGGTYGTQTRNSASGYAQNVFVYDDLVPDSAGTITHCWARVNNIGGTSRMTLIVFDASGTMLGYVDLDPSTTTEAWQGGALSASVCLEAATPYYVGVVSQDTGWNFFFDSSESGFNRQTIAFTYDATPGNADFSSPTLVEADTAFMLWCNDTGVAPT